VQPDVSCVVNAPQRTPYLPGHGWAEEGHTFVLVSAFFTVDSVEVGVTSSDVGEVTPRLTLDGAEPLPPDGRYGVPEQEPGAASGTWAFDVPDDTVGELTISLDCLLDGGGEVTLEQTVPLG
jgi:hypothetical protein